MVKPLRSHSASSVATSTRSRCNQPPLRCSSSPSVRRCASGSTLNQAHEDAPSQGSTNGSPQGSIRRGSPAALHHRSTVAARVRSQERLATEHRESFRPFTKEERATARLPAPQLEAKREAVAQVRRQARENSALALRTALRAGDRAAATARAAAAAMADEDLAMGLETQQPMVASRRPQSAPVLGRGHRQDKVKRAADEDNISYIVGGSSLVAAGIGDHSEYANRFRPWTQAEQAGARGVNLEAEERKAKMEKRLEDVAERFHEEGEQPAAVEVEQFRPAEHCAPAAVRAPSACSQSCKSAVAFGKPQQQPLSFGELRGALARAFGREIAAPVPVVSAADSAKNSAAVQTSGDADAANSIASSRPSSAEEQGMPSMRSQPHPREGIGSTSGGNADCETCLRRPRPQSAGAAVRPETSSSSSSIAGDAEEYARRHRRSAHQAGSAAARLREMLLAAKGHSKNADGHASSCSSRASVASWQSTAASSRSSASASCRELDAAQSGGAPQNSSGPVSQVSVASPMGSRRRAGSTPSSVVRGAAYVPRPANGGPKSRNPSVNSRPGSASGHRGGMRPPPAAPTPTSLRAVAVPTSS